MSRSTTCLLSVCLSVLCGRWFKKASIWRALSGRSTRLHLLPVYFLAVDDDSDVLGLIGIHQLFPPVHKHAQTSYLTWSLFPAALCRSSSRFSEKSLLRSDGLMVTSTSVKASVIYVRTSVLVCGRESCVSVRGCMNHTVGVSFSVSPPLSWLHWEIKVNQVACIMNGFRYLDLFNQHVTVQAVTCMRWTVTPEGK